MNPVHAALASAVAGAVAVSGFAPFGFWPLTLAGLVVLFAMLGRADSPRLGGLLGFAWGFGFFLAGVSWVYVSLHVYGGMPMALALVATVLFCAFLAAFPALAGVFAAWVRSPAWRTLAAAPLAFVVIEWVRGWIFTGFPWLAVGYSQAPSGPLAGFAPVLGVYGVSTLLVFAAAFIAFALRRAATPRARLVTLGTVAGMTLAGMALGRIVWTEPAGDPVSVALIQGNVPQDLKWQPEVTRDTLRRYAQLVEAHPAKLTVLPETALPLFESDVPPEYFEHLASLARREAGDVLVGLPTGRLDAEYFNSVVSVGHSPSQAYHKVHLVPFGEYIPNKWLWGWLLDVMQIPLSDFARGSPDQRPLAVAGQRVAVNICYEDVFGEEIIRQLPEATVLVNVSNLAWFGDSLAPWQHAQKSQMRALETGRMMLRATNTGLTAVIDRDGRLVEALPLFTRGVLVASVQGYAGTTPYVRWGNAPIIALWAGLLAVLVWRTLRS